MSINNYDDLAASIGAEFFGKSTSFTSINTDSRTIKPRECFLAIKGEEFDGHDYVDAAIAAGASGCIVTRKMPITVPQIVVTDTLLAYADIAANHRNNFSIPVVGITGSCGKTTTKEMLASILHTCGRVHANKTNFNNEIGLPHTLLHLNEEHDYSILEMGARKAGDISYLVNIARPNITLVTNAGPAHLQGFGDMAGVAAAKGEIYTLLDKDGVAIVNLDDMYSSLWQKMTTTKNIITFSSKQEADVTCRNIKLGESSSEFELVTSIGNITINIAIPGKHMVQNAVAAAAIALALKIPLENIVVGLANFKALAGRLRRLITKSKALVLDDCYNANPQSMKAALDVLASYGGQKIFVMGDMLDLGSDTFELHKEIGHYARTAGVCEFLGVGDLTKNAVAAFGATAKHFSSKQKLLQKLFSLISPEVTILIKGSNGMRLNEVVTEVCAN